MTDGHGRDGARLGPNGEAEHPQPVQPAAEPTPHHEHDLGEAQGPIPYLDRRERREVESRVALRPQVIHETIRLEGEAELLRPTSGLAWSGLAAGLSMGFSLITEGALRSHLPEADWATLITKLGYPVGFLIVVLGRQQLFTENTLTPILPLLVRRNLQTLMEVARLWGVVLAANMLGVTAFTALIAGTEIAGPEMHQAFAQIGRDVTAGSPLTLLLRGIFAGWLIALMVWLQPAAESARFWVIVAITYVIGIGSFPHIVAGSIDALYLVFTGELAIGAFLVQFFIPTLVGNIIGGVSLVAALNHAQVVAGEPADTA